MHDKAKDLPPPNDIVADRSLTLDGLVSISHCLLHLPLLRRHLPQFAHVLLKRGHLNGRQAQQRRNKGNTIRLSGLLSLLLIEHYCNCERLLCVECTHTH